jgi:hypothetical protein
MNLELTVTSTGAGLTASEQAIMVASITALATLLVAVVGALAAYFASKRERRRILYSEATRAAVRWKEMLYRVRRRTKDQTSELVAHFHSLQDDLSYYQAWVGNDAAIMKRSYDRLVSEIKSATEELITEAWGAPIRPAPGNAQPEDIHPDTAAAVDAFLKDVRSHLSPWPWRKLAVMWRNRHGGPRV